MRTLLLFGVLVLAIAGFFVVSSSKPETETKTIPTPTSQTKEDETKTVEAKASFAIFTTGTFRIFTDPKYHNLSPDVFIESSNPNLIRIKKSGITWGDFFKTLPIKLTRDCLTTGTGQTFCTKGNLTLKFYLNEKIDPVALDRVIKNGDRLLVSYGNNPEAQIQNQLQQIPKIK